jgi:hypothetical protein
VEQETLSVQKYEPLYNKIALIDADIICHRSANIAEPVMYQVNGVEYDNAVDAKKAGGVVWSRKEDRGLEFALMVAEQTVDTMLDNAKPRSYQMFLSGRDNFRYKVAKTVPYKSSREYLPRPKYLRKVRDFLREHYNAVVTDGYEADDAIGMESTRLGKQGFVCTIDKDMDQLAGWHYDWVKDRVYRISGKEALFNLYQQVLTGDSTDDVPGLPGIGPVKARRILDGATDSNDLLRRVWDQYRNADIGGGTDGGKWDYFIEQLRLVYILRGPEDLEHVDLSFDAVFGKTSQGTSECNESERVNTGLEQRLSSLSGSTNEA